MATLLNRRRYMGGGGDIDYSKQYLTFEALEDGTFQFVKAIQYSLDNGNTWTSLAANTTTPTVLAGQKIMWKGTYTPQNATNNFSSTGRFNVEGNPSSVCYGDNFISANLTNLAFTQMFRDCTKLVSAKRIYFTANLANNCFVRMFMGCTSLIEIPTILPALTLYQGCYFHMFDGCASLLYCPQLPATSLAANCYECMFCNCSSITIAPELNATTLYNACYKEMFRNCTSLTTPTLSLPATTLTNNCYYHMFSYTALTYTPVMAPTVLAEGCCQRMFSNCTSLETVRLTLPATTLAKNCYYGMFASTKITQAPVLPAETLIDGCYGSMFDGCKKLNYIKAMFTTTPGTSYTVNWVRNVPSGGTFVKNSAATWADTFGNNAIPTGWAVETASS